MIDRIVIGVVHVGLNVSERSRRYDDRVTGSVAPRSGRAGGVENGERFRARSDFVRSERDDPAP